MKTFIVIAAYNESAKIRSVIRDLRKKGYNHIVVVDDGSRDNTHSICKKEKVHALRHIINRGQGAALQTGIDFALRNKADYIITFDADGQHHSNEIKRLIKPLSQGYDIAVGSRFLNKNSNVPFMRRLFLQGGALSFRFLYHVKLTDSHNGFRALTRKAAEKIKITSDDMSHASQIIDEIFKNQLKYKEVPVTITYTDYSLGKGQSTINGFKILFKMIFDKLFR